MGKIGRRTITKAKAVETHVEPIEEVKQIDKKQDNRIKLIKQKSSTKTKPFQMRFTSNEFEIISNYAKNEDLNISDVIRIALIEKGIL